MPSLSALRRGLLGSRPWSKQVFSFLLFFSSCLVYPRTWFSHTRTKGSLHFSRGTITPVRLRFLLITVQDFFICLCLTELEINLFLHEIWGHTLIIRPCIKGVITAPTIKTIALLLIWYFFQTQTEDSLTSFAYNGNWARIKFKTRTLYIFCSNPSFETLYTTFHAVFAVVVNLLLILFNELKVSRKA